MNIKRHFCMFHSKNCASSPMNYVEYAFFIVFSIVWMFEPCNSHTDVIHNNTNSSSSTFTTAALQAIFTKYGHNESLSFDEFQHLLHSIGLANAIRHHHDNHNQHHGHHHDDNADTAEHVHDDDDETEGEKSRKAAATAQTVFTTNTLKTDSVLTSQCLNATLLLELTGLESHQSLSQHDFANLCPLLVLQLDSHTCPHDHLEHHDEHDHQQASSWQPAAVWGYSILSCFIISGVGLLAVAIIPIMHKVIYNHMLQFLVALAVGSLTGDAILHLLPHAMIPHDEHHSHESTNERHAIWCGLTALGGIYMFFLVERIVGMCSERKRRQAHHEQKMNLDMTDTNLVENSLLHATNSVQQTSGKSAVTAAAMPRHTNDFRNNAASRLTRHPEPATTCEEVLMMVHTNKDLRKFADDAHDEVHQHCDPKVKDATWGLSNGGHNHSHHVPGSVASVAWMVIVGDGFHNFADGLAIGSAFASSLTGGLSTSIAVFCHELPHELGDFAMLLNAGMSAKQALVYNCVSSVLCLFGMVVGVVVGNIASATTWIFALIAGLFLYVALVDMLPEMTSMNPKEGEHPFFHLALQNSGMLLGVSVMLVIALFERQLQEAFSSTAAPSILTGLTTETP